MIPFSCPCCEVDRPPHRDGCTLHSDCPSEAATFDEVSSMRAEIDRLREEREQIMRRRWVVRCGFYDDATTILDAIRAVRPPLVIEWTAEDGVVDQVERMQPLPAPPKGGEGE